MSRRVHSDHDQGDPKDRCANNSNSSSPERTMSSEKTTRTSGANAAQQQEQEDDWQDRVSRQAMQGIHNFFFPKTHEPVRSDPSGVVSEDDEIQQDKLFVERFWKSYDDVIIVSLFTQLGIVLRLCAANWFAYVDNTFAFNDALFVSLPLNCLSCWILGFIACGNDVMDVIQTRFTPMEPSKMDADDNDDNDDDDEPIRSHLRRRRAKRRKDTRMGDDELREVQLLAFERRIRESPSLVLFPGHKTSNDLMEHYSFDKTECTLGDLEFQVEDDQDFAVTNAPRSPGSLSPQEDGDMEDVVMAKDPLGSDESIEEVPSTPARVGKNGPVTPTRVSHVEYNNGQTDKVSSVTIDEGSNIFQHEALQNVGRDISTNISRMTRVSLADGWDVGTDAKAMSDDLLLGLRDGFCGALSSFTSWNSSMVSLLQNGQIGEAIVGYTIGLQLPIVSYRFGQHMAVYFFMWRTRRETRTDERRGYGLRLEQHEHSLDIDEEDIPTAPAQSKKDGGEVTDPDQEAPSVRAIVTAVFILGIVAQISSLFFFVDPKQHQLALSLLFSPLGALARWRLSRYNVGRHRFPLGTFACNLSAVALSGSLGTILAGSPGPRERIVLVSFIAGFGGSLSSVAMFIVETLRGIDPLLFRYDGFLYAFSTIFWAMVIGLVSNSTADWAEQAAQSTPVN